MTEDSETGDAIGETADGAEVAAPRLTKAQRLEARAARLREAEQRRAADAAAGKPVPPRGLVIALAALTAVAVALAALLVVTFIGWKHRGDTIDRDQSRLAAARAASVQGQKPAITAAEQFAVDFGTYDYQHLDADFSEVAKKMTTGFAKSYTATSSQLKPTLTQYKTQVTARIQGVGLTSSSGNRAVVVVFLDQTVKTSQSSTPRIDRNRLEVHLVHVKGQWLIAKLLAK
jgi:Mce-associated membrane protein